MSAGLTRKRKSTRAKNVFIQNRDAVRELRRHNCVISSSSLKNEAIQSATATSATTSNNNVDDESNSMQLSAADCGEWLLGRVERVVVVVVGRRRTRTTTMMTTTATARRRRRKKCATCCWQRAWTRRLWSKLSKTLSTTR